MESRGRSVCAGGQVVVRENATRQYRKKTPPIPRLSSSRQQTFQSTGKFKSGAHLQRRLPPGAGPSRMQLTKGEKEPNCSDMACEVGGILFAVYPGQTCPWGRQRCGRTSSPLAASHPAGPAVTGGAVCCAQKEKATVGEEKVWGGTGFTVLEGGRVSWFRGL